jgi:hypothetical protein
MIWCEDEEGWWSARRAIVAPGASRTVELAVTRSVIESRQPVDRARAVENAQTAFPTSSLHALKNARAHAPQAHSFVA